MAEQFTGIPGQVRPARGHRAQLQEIVDGKLDDLPEQAFYMVGPIEDVIEQAKSMQD